MRQLTGFALAATLLLPATASGNDAAAPGRLAPPPDAPGLAAPDSAAIGAELYARHCASCHGATGAGDGPMAALLTVAVPDLTGLAARNEGRFPMLEVVHKIDGRAAMVAHGGPMPVWGSVFMEPPQFQMGLYGTALEARGRIMALALHLEAIQTPPE